MCLTALAPALFFLLERRLSGVLAGRPEVHGRPGAT
jgi:hypothetical protein